LFQLLYERTRPTKEKRNFAYAGDLTMAGGSSHHAHSEWNEVYHEWETKVLMSTDLYASTALLIISVFGFPAPSNRLRVDNIPSLTVPVIASCLLAHIYLIRYKPGFYKKKRESILPYLRMMTFVTIMGGWATSPMRRGRTLHTFHLFFVF
jgi:hypothetical protein